MHKDILIHNNDRAKLAPQESDILARLKLVFNTAEDPGVALQFGTLDNREVVVVSKVTVASAIGILGTTEADSPVAIPVCILATEALIDAIQFPEHAIPKQALGMIDANGKPAIIGRRGEV